MQPAGVITGVITANAGLVLMARLVGQDGQPVTPASVAAIAWQATDQLAGDTAGSGTFAVAASIFGSLVTNDPRWSADATGYNFLAVLPAGTFPPTVAGGPSLTPAQARSYQVDVKFTGTDGSVGYAVFLVQAIPVYF